MVGSSSFVVGRWAALAILVAVAVDSALAPEQEENPYVVVLGVAQDGGVPQVGDKDLERWDDATRHRRVTSLALVDPRTGRRWLFDATPDLPEQLVELDRVAPHLETPGLDGVFLSHAHIGHYTGLMFFGHEAIGASRVPVYAMPRMREYLSSDGPWDQLVRYENIELRELADGQAVQLAADLSVTPFRVPHREEYSEVVGFRIDGPERSLLFIPDIDSYDDWAGAGTRIEDVLRTVDVAYLDGTFWANGEIEGRDMSASCAVGVWAPVWYPGVSGRCPPMFRLYQAARRASAKRSAIQACSSFMIRFSSR